MRWAKYLAGSTFFPQYWSYCTIRTKIFCDFFYFFNYLDLPLPVYWCPLCLPHFLMILNDYASLWTKNGKTHLSYILIFFNFSHNLGCFLSWLPWFFYLFWNPAFHSCECVVVVLLCYALITTRTIRRSVFSQSWDLLACWDTYQHLLKHSF